ncbi:MAG: hypothetical protein JWO13_1526 [Acidobacteriales bacterium]|nr:hypothetical protein [Terriglobales bacterium]
MRYAARKPLSLKKTSTQAAVRLELQDERKKFRESLGADFETQWARHEERIGVVLSGGGARGAYEAGVLLAFQDAKLPTPIIAATSIGSINAAFYAAHSETTVGNAEAMVESWFEISQAAVGIDWFRYILILGGLVATTAGFGNLVREWFHENGVYFHLLHPKWTWLALGLTGAAVMFYYDELPYLLYVLRNSMSKRKWKPDKQKTAQSLIANVVVWGCAVVLVSVAHLHTTASEIWNSGSEISLLASAAIVLTVVLGFFFRKQVSAFSHVFLRLPLRTGLFPNFERTRFLRERIPMSGFRKSPIRVAMTAANVNSGTEKCFTNATQAELLRDPRIARDFITAETTHTDDLMLAVIASSAFPIVYEAVSMNGKQYTDGGIVSNQPIRPAIRMGADVLFLVMLQPRRQKRGEIKTFLDLGVRAIDILTSQNLKTDLKMLNSVNNMCAQYAAELGVRAEQVRLHVGDKTYRYLKAFKIAPSADMGTTVLDFDGELTGPAIVQGYRDGAHAVHAFASYMAALPKQMPKHEVRLVLEKEPAAKAATQQ